MAHFWKIQEILYLIDTKIFQFDLLGAEKFATKDGNPSLKIFEKKYEILLFCYSCFHLLPLHLITFHYPLLLQGFHLIFKIWILLSNINLNTSGTGCSKYQLLKKFHFLHFFNFFLGGLPSLDPIFSTFNRSNWKIFVSIR